MSLDPVAVDSVGVDFLRSEFGNRLANGNSANCDNYLHEAANADTSPNNYTQGGSRLPSLGVHEHWNNAANKQYSRNLSPTATGVELVAVHAVSGTSVTITHPANGAALDGGSPVAIEAAVSNTYASVREVEFRASSTFIGSVTNAPFRVTWTNPPAGIWRLTAVATDTDNLRATSAVVTVTVRGVTNVAPAIITQPVSQSAFVGGSATFVVEATGWPVPTYYWCKDGVPITGATGSSLTLGSVTVIDIGTYWGVASNAAGSVTSMLATLSVSLPAASVTFIPAGARWKYYDRMTDLGTAWRAPAYDDSSWSNGLARLGYGGDGEVTQVTSNRARITTYFRLTFTVADTNRLGALNLRLQRDDGAVLYLNGTELWRDNMSNGPVVWSTVSSNTVSGADETAWFNRTTDPSLLRIGTNVLAAEVHQCNNNSSDLAFNFEAIGIFPSRPLEGLGPCLGTQYDGLLAGFTIRFFAQPGRQYRLLCSTNLVHWLPIQTNLGAGAMIELSHLETTNPPACFYRVASP